MKNREVKKTKTLRGLRKGMTASEIKEKILPILKKYKVKRAGIFGSVVRDEETEQNDIDILVEIEEKMSLLQFVGLKLELEEVLKRKVDLGEYSVIKPVIREEILREEVVIL